MSCSVLVTFTRLILCKGSSEDLLVRLLAERRHGVLMLVRGFGHLQGRVRNLRIVCKREAREV